jgi:hypothetical protein
MVDLRELLARTICFADHLGRFDAPASINYQDKHQHCFVPHADAIITALDAAGLVVVPSEPTEAILNAVRRKTTSSGRPRAMVDLRANILSNDPIVRNSTMEVTRENVMAVAMTNLRSMADDYLELGEVGTSNVVHGLLDEIECLRALKEPNAVCYWDANNNEYGFGDPGEILENYDAGSVVEIEHVAVVMTTFEARLPPADDADSDDDWEVVADTLEEAAAAVQVERERRKALAEMAAAAQ